MDRFDWRKAEPLALEGFLERRYSDAGTPAGDLWAWLVSMLREAPEAALPEIEDTFFRGADDIAGRCKPGPAEPCVFISHQRADAHLGERIACLADHRGVDTWLDVHDPTLAAINRASISPRRQSLLIAAIVEIALLHATHVIAVHTSNSLTSKWVPYELARAKARQIASKQAAGWFQGGPPLSAYPPIHGDYVQLVEMFGDEAGVFGWLPGSGSAIPADPCQAHNNVRALR